MRYIYFSPHLDDAVLSAGGLIYDQTRAGKAAEIWTFMCGLPGEAALSDYARKLHESWGTGSVEDTFQVRRAEDLRAASAVGAKAVHFDFLDCIYRRGRSGEPLYESVYMPLAAADADLAAQVAQAMIAWLRPDDFVIAQLGIGGHVDHVITRRAAEMLPRQVMWIADLPYLLKDGKDLAAKTAGMTESIEAVSERGVRAWQKAIQLYPSQLSTLFASSKQMREDIRAYWSGRHGVRLWRTAERR